MAHTPKINTIYTYTNKSNYTTRLCVVSLTDKRIAVKTVFPNGEIGSVVSYISYDSFSKYSPI